MKLVILKLTKHYGCNMAGEVCGFSPDVAEWILKNNGGVEAPAPKAEPSKAK